jgi:parallel beta-helix repeat protein
MDGCRFKNLGGSAVKCSGASSFLYFSNLTAEGCRGNSFDFSGITYPKIHGLSVDAGDGRNGIVVSSCNYAQISGCSVTNAGKNGIHVVSSNGTSITGCSIGQSAEYGIYGSGNKSVNCVDCVFEGNKKGDYTSDVVNSSEKQ